MDSLREEPAPINRRPIDRVFNLRSKPFPDMVRATDSALAQRPSGEADEGDRKSCR
jgi:hypothetical protein